MVTKTLRRPCQPRSILTTFFLAHKGSKWAKPFWKWQICAIQLDDSRQGMEVSVMNENKRAYAGWPSDAHSYSSFLFDVS